jgi:hypothetical protein
MKYAMKTPCKNCPFRSDKVFPLHPGRVESILDGITHGDQTFSCHKTTSHDDEDCEDYAESDTHIPTSDEQHCAGAMILLEKLEQPNQMMRIAERVGLYDRTKLDMEAPVYDSLEDMQDAIEELWNERR